MQVQQKTSLIPFMIIGAFVLFGLFIGFMVVKANQQEVNLVRDDYYQQTLQLNAHMEEIARTEASSVALSFVNNEILLSLPASFQEVNGTVHFYRPSDARLDFTVPLQGTQKEQRFATEQLAKGKWHVLVSFAQGGQNYYKELHFTR